MSAVRRLLVAALLLGLAPLAATAQCEGLACIDLPHVPARPADLVPAQHRPDPLAGNSASSAGWISSASAPTHGPAVGDVLPRGDYSIILNADYYGLPPVSDGWVYMRVGADAFRVDWATHRVLARVTDDTAANF